MILRHDVDLSLDAAVRMAELEHDAGATATYFLMTESVFYNLDSSEGVAAIERLRELGHRVAQHAVYPNAPAGRALRSRRRLAQPGSRVHAGAASRRADQRDAGSVVRSRPPTAPTRTSTGAPGCPHDDLRAGAFPWLQLLTHPEIWAFAGETMGQTMRAMLEAEKERRLQQLAEDRIDLA